MIKFFRDVLSGPIYILVVVLAIIFIIAIIGFLMEKKQQQLENDSKYAHVGKKIKKANLGPTNNMANNNEIPSEPVVGTENK